MTESVLKRATVETVGKVKKEKILFLAMMCLNVYNLSIFSYFPTPSSSGAKSEPTWPPSISGDLAVRCKRKSKISTSSST